MGRKRNEEREREDGGKRVVEEVKKGGKETLKQIVRIHSFVDA